MALLIAVAAPAHAGQWQICRIQAQSLGAPARAAYPQLQAKVLNVEAYPANAECPAVGDTLAFVPDTADYQNSLPRKRWPKTGQVFRLRYQYLDGWCKNDGAQKPCRIEVHPVDDF